MDYTFPEKFFKVAQFFDYEFGNLESTTKIEDERKILLYALRQQAERGPCTSAAPSIWWTHESVKHAAWKQLGSMSKFEAMVHFVRLVEECIGGNVNWMEKCKVLEDPSSQVCEERPINASHGDDIGTNHTTNTEDEWDDDVRASLEPTSVNVHYLASQVMLLRREVQHLRDAAAQKGRCGASINPPISWRVGSPANHLNTTQQKVMVPPVRTVPLHMTEAAMGITRSSSPKPQKPVLGWAEWFGLK